MTISTVFLNSVEIILFKKKFDSITFLTLRRSLLFFQMCPRISIAGSVCLSVCPSFRPSVRPSISPSENPFTKYRAHMQSEK